MENILIDFDSKVSELKELVDQLKAYIGEIPTPKKLRSDFITFYQRLDAYIQDTENEDVESISNAANTVAIYGQAIGQGIPQFKGGDDSMKNLGELLLQKSTGLREFVENSPVEYKPMDPKDLNGSNSTLASYKSVKRNLKNITENHLEHDQRIKKLLSEGELRAGNLSSKIEKIDTDSQEELNKISLLYKETLDELNTKKSQINEILGHVSGRAIAGDFDTSASEEKQMANSLRYASLGCMAVIVCVVGYTFLETTSSAFQWQNSVFRVALAVMLSVPAAYLARESAKHREQQYSHLQTSLDLKAITPYIASLPSDEQHKIKIEVASRLFASRDFSKVGADPYPINVHEVVMELIKKLEINKASTDVKNG